jgi:MFS superfamily sulfate permease-like transporter
MTNFLPPIIWLRSYRAAWLPNDVIAGITLAAYAIPVSLAYATLAGLPPQVGVYGYLLGGLGYALLGSSRQLAIGPTSAISLMIAGTVGAMAEGDPQRYAQIASLAGFTVAALCLIAWLLRLSTLVKLVSDSILVGFKAGAGLTIAITQLPGLLGISGGGHNFIERVLLILSQLGQTDPLVLAVGIGAVAMLLAGDRLLPGRPVALGVVVIAIVLASGYALDPRQEFLGIGAANLGASLGQGYPVAGGLSQSAVNDKAGARTPLALVFASLTLAVCLLFLTGLLENLPKAVLAAVVLTAVRGLIDFPALLGMWRISRLDFYAAIVALFGVLLLGILQGILLAALASVLMLLARASRPHVAFLGRIPGTNLYSDRIRHPENEELNGIIAFRPEGSLIYVSSDTVLQSVLDELNKAESAKIRLVVCDLSNSPHIDLAGSRMLHQLADELTGRQIALRITGAHGRVRDLLRADKVSDKVGGLDRAEPLEAVLSGTAVSGSP